MVFSSIIFLLYFLPIFILFYYIVKPELKNVVILIASVFFYSWGAPKFIFVILGTTFIDFHLVKWMYHTENELKRKLILTFSVCMNFGLLFYFKYYNFFIENVDYVLQAFHFSSIRIVKIILPIGISFYTFETITYVVDVYRKLHKPLDKFWNYQLYIILFPKLIAGPIVRYHEIADQIEDRSQNETIDNILAGFYQFVIGLAKKVILANNIGVIADEIFKTDSAELSSLSAWTGIVAYSFQIYFDFSGYSDMAIGIAKMIGFKLPENFNSPYISKNITEFWRRWHITLGNWMKNYLYIPLGGNRTSKWRGYLNLWIVFLASGIWHGASWNFAIWGIFHGCFLVFDRTKIGNLVLRAGNFINIVKTYFIVLIGWVFFRADNLHHAFSYLKTMFSLKMGDFQLDSEGTFYMFLCALFAFWGAFKFGQKIINKFYYTAYNLSEHFVLSIFAISLMIICIMMIASSDFNPFIYFRF